jgi:scyllo-inositol 2-dehydrogenase (NADP+)
MRTYAQAVAGLRIAIVGFGLAGRVFHAPLITATPGLQLAAIVTADPERRSQAALAHPGAELLESAAQLWERAEAFDAVVIASPSGTHAALATAAIDHRLAVVVDKPLAADAAAAARVAAHAADARVMLTVFQNRRWDADQLILARLLAGGELGEVLRVESRLERWRPQAAERWRDTATPAEGGGLLLDLGTHLVDQALWHFGPVRNVYAEVDRRRGAAAEDDAFLALTHRSGVICHLSASALAAAPGPRLRVLGREAALVVTRPDSQEDRLRAGERPDQVPDWGVEPPPARPRLVVGERSVPLQGPPGDWPAFYRALRAALAGEGPPPVDPVDAVAALAVLDAARVSAAERRVVEL